MYLQRDDEMNHFENDLDAFIQLGADIIATDAGKRYGHLFNGVLLQPGFMPTNGHPKLCYIGINPSSNKPVDYDAECALYELWEMDRTHEAYGNAYERWLMNFLKWTVSQNAINLLGLTHLQLRDLAWLNVVKVRDENSRAIDERIAHLDFHWLKKQLSLMGEDVFIVLGTNDSRYVFIQKYLLEKYGQERIGIRGQRGSGESIERIAARLNAWRSRLR